MDKLGTAPDGYDADTKTCTIYANVHYRVIYAEVGAEQYLQKYIVRAEKRAEPTHWTFNRGRETEP